MWLLLSTGPPNIVVAVTLTDFLIFVCFQNLKETRPKCFYNARGEELLRKSGLTYTIIRVEGFNNLPGGIQAIEIKQARL